LRTRSLLKPRAAAALALVEPALRGNVLAVHDFRVAARSLRAGLRTLPRRPESATLLRTRRTLQIAIRSLADPRDRDVGRALLLKQPSTTPELADLRRRLLGLAESDRRMALARCAEGWPAGLHACLIDLLTRAEPSVETVIQRTRVEAFRQRGRAIALLAALGRRYDAIRLHDLRRRVRSLRYALEILAEVDRAAPPKLALLKPLQSALGDIQDRIVLSRWLSSQAARFRRSDPPLASHLRDAAFEARERSKEAHRRFLALSPARVLERLALHVDAEEGTPLSASVPPNHHPQSTARPRGDGSARRAGSRESTRTRRL
jgi:CHAD domain-containing protein